MPDPFKRYMIIECEKMSIPELKEYMKELGNSLSELEPGDFDYAIVLAMLVIAADVHDTKIRGMKPRRHI